MTSIGKSAFTSCSSLTSVTIPNSVTDIGNSAFRYCSSLTSITLPNNLISIGSCTFEGCSSLTSITIPNSVLSIWNLAFSGCSGLTAVVIPNSVSRIEESAFEKCSGLTSLTIGSGIYYIANMAFASCPELTDVYCYAEKAPPASNAFKDSYIEYATLHVPKASIDNYNSKNPWSAFKTIIGLDGTMPDDPEEQETPKCATPTINYNNGKLKFGCETEGVEYISEITDKDVKKFYTSEVDLTATYTISVYATKNGYDNSDVAKATLCWIDADPVTEGITNGVANVRANAVLIQTSGNIVSVSCAPDNSQIRVYNLSGQEVGHAITSANTTVVGTSLQVGDVGIVKIGSKVVKVVMK